MNIQNIRLEKVFVRSGVPEYTFVQPQEYRALLVALRTPGRSVVVEGPSGIGKTTAVLNAIREVGLGEQILNLSARKSGDADLIRNLSNHLPVGNVLIDDFHRLDDNVKRSIADLMKTLADESASHSKIIVLGINNAGQALISFGSDLAHRVEIIPFEANPEHKIDELIAKGEKALNITINVRNEIIKAAQGSFYLAQMLAHETCLHSDILETVFEKKATVESYELVKDQVMQSLKREFHDVAIEFARGKKLRPEGRAPYLHLLNWISQSNSWSININREIDRHPEQRGSVKQVVSKGFLSELINSSQNIQQVLHFDSINSTLVVQDPKFVFYIRNLSWSAFAEEIGYETIDFPSRYDFALSFAGTDRRIAEALFKALQENELEVFYDQNEQHRMLAENVEDYLRPIYSSDAMFVICILSPDYPTRIWTRVESSEFVQRFKNGEVIPIVLDITSLGAFSIASGIGYMEWNHSEDVQIESERIAKVLCDKLRDKRQRQD